MAKPVLQLPMGERLQGYDWVLGRYDSDQTEIFTDIVVPMLNRAVQYDRSVGYLKKSHLTDLGYDLFCFVEKGGRARFLFGDPLDKELLLAYQHAVGGADGGTEAEKKLRLMLKEADPHKGGDDLAATLMQYLVAVRAADFRLVLRETGIHHEKVRIATDHFGDCLVAVGSDNDSVSALSGKNCESGTLIASWIYPETNYWESHGAGHLDQFERKWENKHDESITLSLSEQVRLGIQADWEARGLSYERLRSLLQKEERAKRADARELKDYQEDAIQSWQDNDYQGVMALCTGAGKTFTTIKAAEMLDIAHRKEHRPFAVVVAVPYQILAHQWVEELSLVFGQVISCWSENDEWRADLAAAVFGTFNEHSSPSSFAVVVVNDTFLKSDFQELLDAIPSHELMFVGDEVHRHGTRTFEGKIPPAAYRLGLSATPWSSGEDERERLVKASYGEVVIEFGIKEAIDRGVLCNYNYLLTETFLSEDEALTYKSVSADISVLLAQILNGGRAENDPELRRLFARRNSILGTCESKLEWLTKYAGTKIAKQTLIYCSEGRGQIDGEYSEKKALNTVAELFHGAGWDLGKITAEESSAKRKEVLSDFQSGHIDAIAAIRVLDEGFDLPGCRSAFLLSSSKNERQFIQRRGRVLRTAKNKKEASIFDFLVLPGQEFSGEAWAQELAERELVRAWEFARFSMQVAELESTLSDIANDYEIDFITLKKTVEDRAYISEDVD